MFSILITLAVALTMSVIYIIALSRENNQLEREISEAPDYVKIIEQLTESKERKDKLIKTLQNRGYRLQKELHNVKLNSRIDD